jgi:hypothetical protein
MSYVAQGPLAGWPSAPLGRVQFFATTLFSWLLIRDGKLRGVAHEHGTRSQASNCPLGNSRSLLSVNRAKTS